MMPVVLVMVGFLIISKSRSMILLISKILQSSALLYVLLTKYYPHRFPVERWLDKKEDDGRISLDLQPNKKPESKKVAGQ